MHFKTILKVKHFLEAVSHNHYKTLFSICICLRSWLRLVWILPNILWLVYNLVLKARRLLKLWVHLLRLWRQIKVHFLLLSTLTLLSIIWWFYSWILKNWFSLSAANARWPESISRLINILVLLIKVRHFVLRLLLHLLLLLKRLLFRPVWWPSDCGSWSLALFLGIV